MHIDSLISNEYGFQTHDFGLIYNYFARASHPYGAAEWSPANAIFFESPPLDTIPTIERSHVDCYLAMSPYDGTGGLCNSQWTDPDEDPGSPEWHQNSFNCTDGDSGKAKGNQNWYVSGSHANLMFDHEYQHICNYSNTGRKDAHWPNEFFSTAAEYLSGISSSSYLWELQYDLACDAGLISPPWQDCHRYDPFGMWRIFATYLLHQFNSDESQYADDLLHQWVSNWRSYQADDVHYPGLYCLAKELEKSPWSSMLSGTDGLAKLQSLFQDWSIAKALNDSTLKAPGDSITLGFKRGFSPYYDVGLFRDVDASCCAANSRVLPHEHLLGNSSLNEFTWVASYTTHEDSLWGDCDSCKCDSILTVAEKADPIDVSVWASDYMVFRSDDSLGSGGPYDLKIKIRGEMRPPFHPTPNTPPMWNKIQVAVLTYSSADSIFRTSDNLIEVRKVDIDPDSAKANVTVCDFGGSVKAAVVIVGLVWDYRGPWDPDGIGVEYMDNFYLWNYKYGYTVEKHWKSGAIPWNVAWFDSIHVNGDVSVLWNRTLTIEPGTRVEFYPGDTQHKLIVSGGWGSLPGGKLVAEGAASDSILFTSGATSPGSFDWYGVQMLKGGSPFEPKYCTFEYASIPIVCTGDTLALDSCLIQNFGSVGIYASDTSLVTVEDTRIDMGSGNTAGIKLCGNTSGTVTRDTIQGNGSGAGVQIIASSAATMTHNTISSVYTGIYAFGESLSSSYDKISGFQNDGIEVSGSTVSISYDTVEVGSTGVRGIELRSTSSGTVSHNYITSSGSGTRYGIETSDGAIPVIEYNQIDGPMHGIRCTGSSSPQIVHNWIKNTTGNGIQCSEDASPTVRYTTIENFRGTAVSAVDYALLNLGACSDSGSNRIYTSQSFSYYVATIAQDPVSAEYNWWGTKSPSSKKFYGNVDYLPCDTLDPGTSYSLPLLPMVSPAPWEPYAMQSYPNPFNPRTMIEYGVSEPGVHVRILVYDISGRVVKVLVNRPETPGRFRVTWDGKNERGDPVASGVYFYEVVIGEFRQAKKLVVLR